MTLGGTVRTEHGIMRAAADDGVRQVPVRQRWFQAAGADPYAARVRDQKRPDRISALLLGRRSAQIISTMSMWPSSAGGKVPGSGPGDKVPALLESGEFVVRKKIVDKFGPTFFAGLNGMKGGGIAGAVDAARGAGFRGENLVRAVAIAGAESRYNAKAQNLKYPDHSIGLWQINQLAHKGRFGSDSALKNPLKNAKAAFALFRSPGFRPWSTWPGAAQGYMAKARAAVLGSRGKAGGGGGSGGSVGGSIVGSNFGPPSTGGGSGGGGGGDGDGGVDPAQAERDRIAAELLAINTQIAANQLKILALAGQGDQIVGAVVAAVNGGIGGRVGLGFHGIRSTPGSVANL